MAAAAAGAAIQAGGNVIGSTVSGLFGMLSQRDRIAAEAQMATLEREFRAKQTELAQSYGAKMQQNSFQNQSSLSDQVYKQNLGLSNNAFTQTQTMYNTELNNKREALRQAGLPDYLATMPVTAMPPRMSQRGVGGQLYTSMLPGDPRTSPYINSPVQHQLGWGRLPSS